MLFFCLSLASVAFAQQSITVKGNVKDPSGEPIIGASIRSGSSGTVSDLDGNFTLNVPGNATIQVTYLGYLPQNISVNNRTDLTIVMSEDAKSLEEVVIVGYGTQRVKDLTGAATPVKVDDLANLPGASIVDALAGQVVGLSVTQSNGRPGATGTFKVRQPVSFDDSNTAFNQPLIVIDDVVQVNYNGEPDMTAFNMLDLSEIESMTVLKDASAAVYGSRASAGVILVKTKKGRAGTPKISYSGKLDFSDAVSHTKTMNAYETGLFTNRMIRQTAINNEDNALLSYMYSDGELNAMKSLNYDWLDKAWSSAVSHRHSLSVDGGSDKVTYFAGITYQNQDTNLGNVQDFDKWTFRAGGEIKVATGLKLSASVSGYNSKQTKAKVQADIKAGPWGSNKSSDDYSQLRHMPKYIPWEYEIDGEMQYVSPWMGPIEVNVLEDAKVGNGYPVWNFFANEASKARRTNETNGYNANFSLTYDVPFIKGLTLKGTYAVSYGNKYDNEVGDYYRLARAENTNQADAHLLGEHTRWGYINYGDPNGSDVSKKPGVTYTKSTSKSEQMNFMLTYNRTFGLHDIGVTGVIERAENEGNESVLHYDGVQSSYNGTSGTAGTLNTTRTKFSKYESGALSYVGRASYKYDNRYLLQFVIRADASTKFAPENYWGTFPTGSVGWVLSEEKFFQNSKLANVFDFLKFRYSLGKTGKDNVEAWRWMQIYKISATDGLGFGPIGGQPSNGANLFGTANRDIKWDSTIKNNLGIDMNVLSNRLALSVDYYYDKTKDLIMFISDEEEPIYIGAAVPAANYGKKNAWGWEFSARWTDQIKQGLVPSWGPIRYGIGMDYSISWQKTVLGENYVFDYPGEVDEKGNRTGWQSPGSEWGFRTWKNTSKGDGMLRTQEDIDKYWAYLTELATAAGLQTPNYLGITNKDNMKLGMLAYEDINGDIDTENKTIAGPNGVISRDHAEDYVKLANKRRHSINTKLSLQWGNFSWQAQLSTQWGGYSAIDSDVAQSIGKNSTDFIWSQFAYMNDMFDPVDNPNGKYPSMAVASTFLPSDFWQVSTFRCYVRNMTFGYTFPKNMLTKTGIDKLQVTLTGNNLWDFYNPYPGGYRNMYDRGRTDYPTLRTWTLGLNLTF